MDSGISYRMNNSDDLNNFRKVFVVPENTKNKPLSLHAKIACQKCLLGGPLKVK